MRRSSYLVCVGLGKCAVRVRSALLSFALSGFAFGFAFGALLAASRWRTTTSPWYYWLSYCGPDGDYGRPAPLFGPGRHARQVKAFGWRAGEVRDLQ